MMPRVDGRSIASGSHGPNWSKLSAVLDRIEFAFFLTTVAGTLSSSANAKERSLIMRFLAVLLLVGFVNAATAACAEPERFLDSDEAKEKSFRQGCAITDYSDMVSGEDIEWVWGRPSAGVGAPGALEIKQVRNNSDVTDPEIAGKVEKDLRAAFERIGKSIGKGGLVATACVYWMQRFNSARAMVPFAGMHLMQAGIGIEVSVADASGKVLAKVRHSGREGKDPAEAAAAVADRIVNYLRDH